MDKTITSMSTTTLLGTRDDDGFSRDGCTEFTGKYRCRSCLRKRGLLQAQRDDRVHYALAYLPIEIFCVRFELDRRKKIGSPTTIVIGTKCKPPPPRGKASCAPKIRIGTTGASVFAITNPSPG